MIAEITLLRQLDSLPFGALGFVPPECPVIAQPAVATFLVTQRHRADQVSGVSRRSVRSGALADGPACFVQGGVVLNALAGGSALPDMTCSPY